MAEYRKIARADACLEECCVGRCEEEGTAYYQRRWHIVVDCVDGSQWVMQTTLPVDHKFIADMVCDSLRNLGRINVDECWYLVRPAHEVIDQLEEN